MVDKEEFEAWLGEPVTRLFLQALVIYSKETREQFDQAAVAKKLRRFHRRGPDKTTRLLIEALRSSLGEARDTMLLDVGGGLGAIHHALLGNGVSRAVHVDASSASIAVARQETERRGHGAMVEFVRGDFVSIGQDIAVADIVTLDRVICCYHDMPGLVDLAASKTRQFLAAVYPRSAWWMRVAFAGSNALFRLRRSDFRVFVHDPPAINERLREAGLGPRLLRRTIGWEIAVYERSSGGSS